MWILTYDKKYLVDAKHFRITKNIGGKKDQKWAIYATGYTSNELSVPVCTCFSDEDRAIAELEKVAAFTEENPGKVYRFSK